MAKKKEQLINYDVVSEFAGHQSNKDVSLGDASKDIFYKVKEKSMEVAVKGQFIEFDTIDELKNKLASAAVEGITIKVFDQVLGG